MIVRDIVDKADAAAEGAMLRLLSRLASLVLVPVFVAGVLWLSGKFWDFNNSIVSQGISQSAVVEKLAETNRRLARMSDRLDTIVPRAEIDARFADHEQRIRQNAQRLERIESERRLR